MQSHMKSKTPQEPKLIRLNIAGGQQRIEGYTNIDIAKIPESDIVHDLNVYPWPIKSESVEEALCSHYVEHIPMLCACAPSGKQDPLFAFFDELYRIMVMGGKVQIVTPYYANSRAFQDPTHRRFIPEATFLYPNEKWRQDNKLDHYSLNCNFAFTQSYSIDQAWGLKADDARNFGMRHYWNVVSDMVTVMIKEARLPSKAGAGVVMADTHARINGKPDPKLRRTVCKV